MRSKQDAKIGGGRPRAKRKPLPGGKALQRLFAYLGKRDPAINDEVVAAVPVQKSARPRFGLTARARRAPVAPRGRPRTPAAPAKSYAATLSRAAATLSRGRRGARPRRSALIATDRAAIARAMAPAPSGPPLWKSIGPSLIPNGQTYGTNRIDVIGRVSCLAIDPKNEKHLLCGSAGGGIWETMDAGASWKPRTDQMPSLAIGAIAFDPVDSKIAYAGSGEGNFYFNLGAGVYRSTDGGTTWTVIASAPFAGVGFYDLVIDPKNRKRLFAATTSGFHASTNAGSTWTLKRAGRCWDISMHPAGGPAAEILATFQDGLFVSTTGGNSFAAVSLPSAPAGAWSRLAVDRVTQLPDIAYVFGAAGSARRLWRRSGTTWTKITTLPPGLNSNQAWYDWYVAASPVEKGVVYLGAIDTHRGILTGSTWSWKNITSQGSNSIHPDQHCLAFAPSSAKTIYLGNDGGVYRSANGGGTWKALNDTLGITEIEFMASDPTTSKWLMAGTQDNGTIRFKGASSVWDHIADGDGGDCGVNHVDPNEIYHSYYDVSLERSSDKGNTWTWLAPPGTPALFYPPVEVYATIVAIGGASLVISRTSGTPWTTFALGLPAGDVASAMDIPDANTVFVGTMQGRVLRVSWNGTNWTKTLLTSPAPRYISCITADPGTPARLWVTISQLVGGRVYRSDNTGSTWVNCTGSLPNIPVNSVAVDPANGKRVWVAADVGVYQTVDMGVTWTSFSNGLPNAMAADLVFHKKDRVLFCGTRNRGAWVVAVP